MQPTIQAFEKPFVVFSRHTNEIQNIVPTKKEVHAMESYVDSEEMSFEDFSLPMQLLKYSTMLD